MKIQWLGHSAFKLEESTGTVVITDPFSEDLVGYKMTNVDRADIITVSHSHSDHNNIAEICGNPTVLDTAGGFEIGGVHFVSVQSYHDSNGGKDRGDNLIFKMRMDGVDICHLGDIGEECSIELSETIGAVNVLLIPVGGEYTIDATEAKEYVDLLMPDIAIPMHYKTRDCDLSIDKVDPFLKLFDEEQIMYIDGEIEFDRADFEGEETKILVFNK